MAVAYLVVLTATIAPAPIKGLQRTDPKVRLEDYKAGLRFWLRHPHPKLDKILFLENSGADLSELRAIADQENLLHKEVEFISMNSNKIPKGVHYGYGEMQMLDGGLEQSRLRRQTSHMIKATGRLTFPSIGKLLDRLPEQLEICVECRIPSGCFRRGKNPFKVLRTRELAYTSTQLLIFSHAFYRRELQMLYQTLEARLAAKEDTHFESVIYPKIVRHEGEPGVFLRWPVDVEPEGIAGHSNQPYRNTGRRTVAALRAVMRRVAPDCWI